ncbi:Xylose isomerase domain-containing protein TIM barrel [Emticicia oligotrophica DSM 17448]|uniref:Xylose isomerase domain-containing protein TIM barrel n=1 Tax=Emticicia oligotrophica (strain DSM 17448 / CIP 109782 / MTCC 6937 / GPTSA100-15) TaxID=929562 RepID=A0ABM5MZ32_EMTOG|nr:TIM barrel protein [Emticicia oligotrophica]AFK02399.1 Xylose isomerase domain-containing protein TIM barrel [Emticicia oligotrophica DSM 17448]
MNTNSSRRSALKNIIGGAAVATSPLTFSEVFAANEKALGAALNGKINHSACRWCYKDVPLEDLCKAAVAMGIKSIELQGPDEWPILKKYGLTCAMPWGAGKGINDGFNDPKNHDELVQSYEEIFPKLKAAGLDKVICFSGNRRGMSDEQGLANCVKGLKRLMPSAEKYGITMTMELLNSKVNHKDYMCDTTPWGVALCDAVGSENFKLLYDIYHMQIMEGDVIATIKKYNKYFSHYHTGGVPGRNEIDDTQELNYPAIMKAIVDTGYKGFVGQEFIPKRTDVLASLKQGVTICDIA